MPSPAGLTCLPCCPAVPTTVLFFIPDEPVVHAHEVSLSAVLCQNSAVAELDELKIPKAVRPVADGAPGHQ